MFKPNKGDLIMEQATEIFDRFVGVAEYAKLQPIFERDSNTRVALGLLGMVIILGGFVGCLCMIREAESILLMLSGFIGGGYLINYACNYSSLPEEVVKNYRQKEVNLINYLAERLDDIKTYHLYRKRSTSIEFKNWFDTYTEILSKSLGIGQVILFSKNLFEMKIARPHLDYYKNRSTNALIAEIVSIMRLPNTKGASETNQTTNYPKSLHTRQTESGEAQSTYSKHAFCAFLCVVVSLCFMCVAINGTKITSGGSYSQSINNDFNRTKSFLEIATKYGNPAVDDKKKQNTQDVVIKEKVGQFAQTNVVKENTRSSFVSVNNDSSDTKYDFSDDNVEGMPLIERLYGIKEDRVLQTNQKLLDEWEYSQKSWLGKQVHKATHLNDIQSFTIAWVIGIGLIIFIVVFLYLDWYSCSKARKEYEETHKRRL